MLVAQLCPILCDFVDCGRQGPLSMGFSKQDHWSELPFPAPGHLPDPGIKPGSPALQANSLPSEAPGKPLVDNSHKKKIIIKLKFRILELTHFSVI